jgi:K+-sensing histidine kinase KdpD
VLEDDEACAVVVRLLAHDLRNPLTAVQLNAQLIERAAAEAAREKEQRWAALIAGAARRLDGLIQQLVEAERVRMGQLQLSREPLAWSQLWRETLAEKTADLDPCRVSLALPDERVTVSGDRDRLGRAIRGLVRLAMQEADAAATVSVKVEAKEGMVRSSIQAPRSPAVHASSTLATGASAPHAPASGITLHFARTVFECHGGSLRAKDGDSHTVGFELVLPTGGATSDRT